MVMLQTLCYCHRSGFGYLFLFHAVRFKDRFIALFYCVYFPKHIMFFTLYFDIVGHHHHHHVY